MFDIILQANWALVAVGFFIFYFLFFKTNKFVNKLLEDRAGFSWLFVLGGCLFGSTAEHMASLHWLVLLHPRFQNKVFSPYGKRSAQF